ncbi:MAG: RNA polymerase sporulation sigma factor SigK [Candidatus Metalachnospira sp.]|nr:RNA polymerase sporulation sigma factor SigK [Candidatus Metalachnospira sp.]
MGNIGCASFPKPLSEEEELLYIEKYKEGDTEARNILIEHNLRLVAHVAKKYISIGRMNSVDFDDIISIGTIGLIKGIDSFNTDKNVRLATYAARCIENEILMYIRSSKKFSGDVFLQDPVGHDFDGNEITVMDIVKTEEDPISYEVSTKLEIASMLDKMKTSLDDRERLIIKMRYGLYNGEEITQREIAKMLGISRSYVSRIEKKALKKIGSEMKN